MSTVETYSTSAKYYDDEYTSKKDLNDVPYYLELAKRVGGPVLEIACGTGRILFPTARQGHTIHGIDNSRPMLGVLERHLQNESQDVQKRVSFSEGDMRTFRLGKKFPLITIPFRPMQHMYTVSDQIAALTTAREHMTDDGILAFNVFYPRYDLIYTGIGEEKLELEWSSSSEPGKIVRRFFKKESVDKIHQFFTAHFIFRTYDGDKVIREEKEPFKMGYFTYPHMLALFELVGLEIVNKYGSFAKTPLDNTAEEMIFELRKKRNS